MAMSPAYRGTARVEVAPPVDASTASARQNFMDTQSVVALSDAVIGPAAQRIRLPNAEELRDSVSARPVGDTHVLEIRAERPQPEQAAAWADSVTQSYVNFRRAEALNNITVSAELTRQRIEALNGQRAKLDVELAKKPSNEAQLQGQRDRLSRQISVLQEQLPFISKEGIVARSPATVIKAATAGRKPVRPDTMRYLAGAGLLGVVLGTARHLIGTRRARRSVAGPTSDAASGSTIGATVPVDTAEVTSVLQKVGSDALKGLEASNLQARQMLDSVGKLRHELSELAQKSPESLVADVKAEVKGAVGQIQSGAVQIESKVDYLTEQVGEIVETAPRMVEAIRHAAVKLAEKAIFDREQAGELKTTLEAQLGGAMERRMDASASELRARLDEQLEGHSVRLQAALEPFRQSADGLVQRVELLDEGLKQHFRSNDDELKQRIGSFTAQLAEAL
ncbi:MAG: hypothetical protein ACRDIA_05610, partial [Actinomycetota bacterium]